MNQPDLPGELAAVVRTLFGVRMAHQPHQQVPAAVVPAAPAAAPTAPPASLPVPDLAPLQELAFLDE